MSLLTEKAADDACLPDRAQRKTGTDRGRAIW